ncbi:hypothetical protein BDB00DRAFT_792094 [Zychaea mexicana]|uniref:uncharacterized protein n=1 Tax=Zychaea mexicana TaxID=64656 RepID=UPI0022FDF2FB|nr:uncharacterized protein BDB00DRAFT_792094 [Zychaea mexicana]KAI9488125.1 hypothetical protein BDB00DRAFT_792094 [Zychaea mexicana]
MSLMHGFKKNLNRAGTTLKQKAGWADNTIDEEFNDEYERFQILEKEVEKLSKEAKNYLEAVRSMSAAQRRMAQTLGQFVNHELTPAMVQYQKLIERMDEDTRADFDKEFRTTVLEPLTRLCSYFPAVNEAIKRRHKKALDYDNQRSKVRKLIDKPSDDPQKLPMAEEVANLAREQYEGLNTILIEDLPKIVEMRVPYVDPSFEALVKSELKFSQTYYGEFESIQDIFQGERKGSVDDILQDMRQLAICGNF